MVKRDNVQTSPSFGDIALQQFKETETLQLPNGAILVVTPAEAKRHEELFTPPETPDSPVSASHDAGTAMTPRPRPEPSQERDTNLIEVLGCRDAEIAVLRARLVNCKTRANEEQIHIAQLEKELSSERESRGALKRELEETRAALNAFQMPSPLGMKMPSPGLPSRSAARRPAGVPLSPADFFKALVSPPERLGLGASESPPPAEPAPKQGGPTKSTKEEQRAKKEKQIKAAQKRMSAAAAEVHRGAVDGSGVWSRQPGKQWEKRRSSAANSPFKRRNSWSPGHKNWCKPEFEDQLNVRGPEAARCRTEVA